MSLLPIAVCDDLEEERALLGHMLRSYAQRKEGAEAVLLYQGL